MAADAHQHLGANPRNLGHQLNEFRRDHAMLRLLTPRRAAVAGVLGMALLGAACSSTDAGTTGAQTPAPSTTAIDDRVEPVRGRLLDRAGQRPYSLEALGQDPVATAASSTPSCRPW